MTEETSGQWLECVIDNDYEIWNDYPYPIRRKGKEKVITESLNGDGYYFCYLNHKKHYKHRIIAQQFIPNPDNLPQVDHINRIRTDNRLENLRWISCSENAKNKTGRIHRYEFFDEIPCESVDDIIEVRDYGEHQFEDLYYCDNWFYFFNGIQYRRLHVNYNKRGYALVYASDVEGKKCSVYYSKLKRLYGIN